MSDARERPVMQGLDSWAVLSWRDGPTGRFTSDGFMRCSPSSSATAAPEAFRLPSDHDHDLREAR